MAKARKDVSVTDAAPRIVTMADGSEVNFGKKANVLTSVDEATNVLTFKLFTGKIISWVLPFVDGLSGFQKTIYINGLEAKVKSSLAPIKLPELEAAILKATGTLDQGIFTVRTSKVGSLSVEQNAYRIVKSIEGGRHFDSTLSHWAELTPTVVQEVSAVWAGFDKSKRNAIRKDAYIRLEIAQLSAASAAEVVNI
jgi:hypothetical protein